MTKKRKSFFSKFKLAFLSSPVFIILVAMLLLNWQTGIFSPDKVDDRDSEYWNFTSSGFIEGAEPFSLEGNNETCWLLIHSYTATPAEMKELATALNSKFNDTIVVPALDGHGKLPSQVQDKNLSYWYTQMENEFLNLKGSCDKVNVVGSSFGSALSVHLAEEQELNNVYLLNTFLYLSKPWYSIVPRGVYISLFADYLHYSKKGQLARINDEEGLKTHLAYWNMPYTPVKRSFPFIAETIINISKITGPLFIAHSPNDVVANPKNALLLSNLSSSIQKEVHWYPESNHVLLKDFNRKQLIADIIKFEEARR